MNDYEAAKKKQLASEEKTKVKLNTKLALGSASSLSAHISALPPLPPPPGFGQPSLINPPNPFGTLFSSIPDPGMEDALEKL